MSLLELREAQWTIEELRANVERVTRERDERAVMAGQMAARLGLAGAAMIDEIARLRAENEVQVAEVRALVEYLNIELNRCGWFYSAGFAQVARDKMAPLLAAMKGER